MSAFGDKCSLCGRNDFLPIRCDLCGILLCTEHRPPPAHDCTGQVDRTHTAKPAEVGLGAALVAGMDEVSRRFEGREWSNKEHFKIKGSASEPQLVENKYMRAYRERLGATDLTEKQRRMTNQVRKMLLKSKATGRSDLHPDERYYLEVRFGGAGEGGGGGEGSEVVDYVFFSRLRTAGRVLDELVGKHQQALSRAYEGWTGVYGLASERAEGWVPLGTTLTEMPAEVLQSCDVVTVLPYTPPPAQPAPPAEGGVGEAGMAEGVAVEPECGDSKPPTASDEAEAAVEEAAAGPQVVLTVQEGKAAHVVRFSEHEWGTATVADLKSRVEALTGMRAYKQKLLFKGVLADAQLLSQTKLKDGSKITLMTASK